MTQKIQSLHLERKAVVYLRQSTLKQVMEHRESTQRQYALRDRAFELGWPQERIEVIDCDLGVSGRSTDGRVGFQRLAEDVSHGRVGGIFALEVSRLARSSADWHRLLDLCGLADVVIADEQSVYAPSDPDDRLMLGLKGTMSEHEQYWMRLRLQGGALSKARRGELYRHPPTGYDWDREKGRLVLSTEERIRSAVRLVFERFRIGGTASSVVTYFARQALLLPTQDSVTHELVWKHPHQTQIKNMLHNPAYAGAYVFGCRQKRATLVNGVLKLRAVRWVPQEEWKACLRDHHPAYIDWGEYVANQEKLKSNRYNHRVPAERGAAREGKALLQGLVLCGRCGSRLHTYFHDKDAAAGYHCCMLRQRLGKGPECMSVSARAVDDAVVESFLKAATPAQLDVTLIIASEVERQAAEISRQWELRLEQARYEARHAEKRYKAVDPENRTVARTLEREWNDALTALEALEQEKTNAEEALHLNLSDNDRQRIKGLAKDLRKVWNAATTTARERKQLLRLAIREITLLPVEVPERATRIRVLWQSGSVEELIVNRGAKRTAPATVERIRAFMESGLTNQQIATKLNAAHVSTVMGRPWTVRTVKGVRARYLRNTVSQGGSSRDNAQQKRPRTGLTEV